MRQILSFSFLATFLIFPVFAESHEEKSTSQYGTDKGYKGGNDKENSRRPRILGRDMGGRFDKGPSRTL